MSKKSLVLHITAEQTYFHHIEGENAAKNEILFSKITQVYLPLLNMFANLEADGVPFKVSMVLPPVLCSLLADPVLQQSYIEWLDRLILLGETEVQQYPDSSEKQELAKTCLLHLKYARRDFTETLNQDILSKFSYYAKRGNIELLGTTATPCFLPHYIDIPEAVNAQIDTGLQSHKHFFDVVPEGFWLPHLGYTPGIENFVRSYGLNYTILDTHGLLFSTPAPVNGIFSPVRCANSLVVFGRDIDSPADVIGPNGYMHNPVYRNQDRDIGFDAKLEYLDSILVNNKSRYSTGFRYWSNKAGQNDDSADVLYNYDAAKKQTALDAQAFLNAKAAKLAEAEKLSPESEELSIVCTFSSSVFGQNWYEGVDWLEQVLRQAAVRTDICTAHCDELTTGQFTFQKVSPYMSAATGTGYGEDILDSSNGWMMRYIRKACERMIDLAERFQDDTGLKARALNLAAKEVLLGQSSDWAQMLTNRFYPDFASEQFRQNITAFTTVFDSLGSNSISTQWLTTMEREHMIFPWINYHVFSRKH